MNCLPMLLVELTGPLLEFQVVMEHYNVTKTRVGFPRVSRIRIVQPLDKKISRSTNLTVAMIKNGYDHDEQRRVDIQQTNRSA